MKIKNLVLLFILMLGTAGVLKAQLVTTGLGVSLPGGNRYTYCVPTLGTSTGYTPIQFVAQNLGEGVPDRLELEYLSGSHVLGSATSVAFPIASAVAAPPNWTFSWGVPTLTNNPLFLVYGEGIYRIRSVRNSGGGGAGVASAWLPFTVIVRPPLTGYVASFTPQTFLHGASVPAFNLTGGIPAGAVVEWWMTGANIGSVSTTFTPTNKGKGNSSPFIAKNTGATPITGTLNWTVMYPDGGCSAPGSVDITVDPNPAVSPALEIFYADPTVQEKVCVNSNPAPFTFRARELPISSPTTDIRFTVTYEPGSGTNVFGAAALPTLALPTSTTATYAEYVWNPIQPTVTGTGTYRITPYIDGSPIPGSAELVTISTRGFSNSDLHHAGKTLTVESGTLIPEIVFSGLPEGTKVLWELTSVGTASAADIAAMGLGAVNTTGTDLIPMFTAINTGSTPITLTFELDGKEITGATCNAGAKVLYKIIINPAEFDPELTIKPFVAPYGSSLTIQCSDGITPNGLTTLTIDGIYLSKADLLANSPTAPTADTKFTFEYVSGSDIVDWAYSIAPFPPIYYNNIIPLHMHRFGKGVYKITPYHKGRRGVPYTFELELREKLRPEMIAQNGVNVTYANGTMVPELNLINSIPAGAKVEWMVDDAANAAAIGLPGLPEVDVAGCNWGTNFLAGCAKIGNFPGFVATNTTDQPITVKVWVKLSYIDNYGYVGAPCSTDGTDFFTITVDPRSIAEDMVMNFIPDQVICDGDFDDIDVVATKPAAAAAGDPYKVEIAFVGGAKVLSFDSQDFAGFAFGAAATILGTDLTLSGTTGTGIYTATPFWGDLRGVSVAFKLTVLPALDINDVDQEGQKVSVANGQLVPETRLTGMPANVKMSWEIDDINTTVSDADFEAMFGMTKAAAKGLSVIPPFTAKNTSDAAAEIHFALSVEYKDVTNGDACKETSHSFVVIISPAEFDPTLTIQFIDNGSLINCAPRPLGVPTATIPLRLMKSGVLLPYLANDARVKYDFEFANNGDDIVRNILNPYSNMGILAYIDRYGKGTYKITPYLDGVRGVPYTVDIEMRETLVASMIHQTDVTYTAGDVVPTIDLTSGLPEGVVVEWYEICQGAAGEVFAKEIGLNGVPEWCVWDDPLLDPPTYNTAKRGNINSFIAQNATDKDIKVQIGWRLSYPDRYTDVGCPLPTGSFTITVKPAEFDDRLFVQRIHPQTVYCSVIPNSPYRDQTITLCLADNMDVPFALSPTDDFKFVWEWAVEGDEILMRLPWEMSRTATGCATFMVNMNRFGKGTYQVTPYLNGRRGTPYRFELELRQLPNEQMVQVNAIFANGDNVPGIDLTSRIPEGAKIEWATFEPAKAAQIGLTGVWDLNVNPGPWHNNGANMGDIPAFTARNATDTDITVTMYYVISYNDNFGCRGEGTFTITVTPKANLVVNAQKVSLPSCDNPTGGEVKLSLLLSGATGSGVFLYTLDGNTKTGDASGVSFDGLKAGTYNYSVFDALIQLPEPIHGTVTLETDDFAPIAVSVAKTAFPSCDEPTAGEVTVSVITGGSGTFLVTLDGNTKTYTPATMLGGVVFDGLKAGTYNINVLDAYCPAMLPVNLVVTLEAEDIDPLVIDVEKIALPTCEDPTAGEIQVTVISGGFGDYHFTMNGVTNDDGNFTDLAAGTYTLVVTDDACAALVANLTVTIEAEEAEPLVIDVEKIALPTCEDPTAGEIQVTVISGGFGDYHFTMNGVTNDDGNFTDLAAGIYNLVVTDDACAALVVNLTVTIGLDIVPLEIKAELTHPTCADPNSGEIDLTVTGGSGTYTYIWSNGEDTEDLTDVPAGVYTVTIIDAGCPALVPVTMDFRLAAEEYLPITLEIDKTNPSCANNDGEIVVTPSGGTGNYRFVWSNGSTTNTAGDDLAAGTYIVTVYDADCDAVAPVTMEITLDPAYNLIKIELIEKTNPTCPGTATGRIVIAVTGGNGDYTYTWSTSDGDGIVAGAKDQLALKAGTYKVVVGAAGTTCEAELTNIVLKDPVVLNAENYVKLNGKVFNYLNGDQVPTINLVSNPLPEGVVIKWTSDKQAIGVAAAGAAEVPGFRAIYNAIAANNTSVITYTVEYADGTTCLISNTTGSFSIVVGPKTIEDMDLQATVDVTTRVTCIGSKFDFTIGNTGLHANAAATYRYELISGVNVLPANYVFVHGAQTPEATVPGKAIYRIIPKYNWGEGLPVTLELDARIPLTIDMVNAQNLVFENNDLVPAIDLTANLPEGAVLTWTRSGSVATGVPANGTGIIPPFKATNTTNATIVSAILYSLSYVDGFGCSEDNVGAFTITVLPKTIEDPDLIMTPVEEQIVCYESDFDPILFEANHRFPTVHKVGQEGTLVFKWELISGVNVIGATPPNGVTMVASGKNSADWAELNTSNTTLGTGVYQVTPIWENHSAKQPIEIKLTRLPKPAVDQVQDIILCNNSPLVVNFIGLTKGTEFVWRVDGEKSNIGLPMSGTNGINVSEVTNSSTKPGIVLSDVIVVTPHDPANSLCEGDEMSFTVSVLPTPEVDPITNVALGYGDVVGNNDARFKFQGTATSYIWTSSNPAINANPTAPSSGEVTADESSIAYLPGFTAQNISQEPIVSKITVTPKYNYEGHICIGAPIEFYVVVASKPVIADIPNKTVCEGKEAGEIYPQGLPAGSGYYITWTGGTTIGLPNSTAGVHYKNIPTFVAAVVDEAKTDVTITVIPWLQIGSLDFAGTPVTFVYTVLPKIRLDGYAELTTSGSPNIRVLKPCMGDDIVGIIKVEARGYELKYQWYKDHIAIPGATKNTYDIFDVDLSKRGDYYVVVSSGAPCPDEQKSMTYIVDVKIPVVEQRWGDAMVLITNPKNNGGYTFSDIQWFELEDGVMKKLPGENLSFLQVAGGVAGRTFIVQATTQDGSLYESCPKTGEAFSVPGKIVIVPNPVKIGEEVSLKTDLNVTKIHLIDSQGRILTSMNATGKETKIVMPNVPGFYIIRVLVGSKDVYEYKVIVQ